jgi:hypothetical protein
MMWKIALDEYIRAHIYRIRFAFVAKPKVKEEILYMLDEMPECIKDQRAGDVLDEIRKHLERL